MALWRIGVTVIGFAFLMVLISAAAGPALVGVDDTLGDMATDRDYLDGPAAIDGMVGSFFEMLTLAIFGIFVWGVARAARGESLFGRRGGGLP